MKKIIQWFKGISNKNPYYPYEYVGGAFPNYYSDKFVHDKNYRVKNDHYWFCTCKITGKKFYCIKKGWYEDETED